MSKWIIVKDIEGHPFVARATSKEQYEQDPDFTVVARKGSFETRAEARDAVRDLKANPEE